HAHFRHDQVPAVAQNLFVRKLHHRRLVRHRLRLRRHSSPRFLQQPKLNSSSERHCSSPSAKDFNLPAAANFQTSTSSRNRGNDAHHVPILRRRILLRQVPDVLVVHIHVHEA